MPVSTDVRPELSDEQIQTVLRAAAYWDVSYARRVVVNFQPFEFQHGTRILFTTEPAERRLELIRNADRLCHLAVREDIRRSLPGMEVVAGESAGAQAQIEAIRQSLNAV